MNILVIRTRLPFFRSLPGRYLIIATMLLLLGVLVIPLSPLSSMFGFTRLPLVFYGWMLLIVLVYIFSAEITKHFFYKRLINKG